MNRLRRATSVLVLVVALPSWGASSASSEEEPKSERRAETRAAMRQLFDALAVAFPLSLDEEAFQDAANREKILAAFRSLSQNAGRLSTHGGELNPSFDFLRRSLVQDAHEALARFESGNADWARFTLQQMTENCFACHSRLPSERQFALGQRFGKQAKMEELSPETRVRLLVATRQFDAALEAYEAIFTSPEFGVGDIYLIGAFEDYLKLCIRVRSDFARAIRALEGVRKRTDTPQYLRDLLEEWVTALETLSREKSLEDGLPAARELVRRAKLAKRFPGDHRGLVHFVVASSLLHRTIDADGVPVRDLAEAYYLLGIAESHISRSSWLSETEFFLESSIRIDPASAFAEDAYAFLEEYTVWGYTGSAGVELPPDVRANLEELRRMIDAAAPAPGA